MRTKPLSDPKQEKQRRDHAKTRRRARWTHDTPSGTSFRQLRRAFANGYAPAVKVKNPEKYLSAHARARLRRAA